MTVLESTAHLCTNLRVPYARIIRAAEQLGLKAAVTINGVQHWDGEQAEQLADHIKGKQGKSDAH